MGKPNSGTFKKGMQKVPGSGRKKGQKNHRTRRVKDMIEQALNEVGGVTYLKKLALAEPKAFAGLIGKIVPTEVKAEVFSGDDLVSAIKAARARELEAAKPVAVEVEVIPERLDA